MRYVGALDQGTTSTRFIIFDDNGLTVQSEQIPHNQIFPKPGWVEHDPDEIWKNTQSAIERALRSAHLTGDDISAVGITNQRETIIPFNPKTGEVYHNAIVWQDLRGSKFIDSLRTTYDEALIREKTGLLYSPYFAASKIRWLLDNVPQVRRAAESGTLVFGTIDTFLTYKLTGGKAVVTDATNASRYMLMNIKTLEWDDEMLRIFGIPKSTLPKIVPSSGVIYGYTDLNGPFKSETPVCGILGDQQAALFGQACYKPGDSKCTYGTGCFMLSNTGESLCYSKAGLLTTVAYKLGDDKPVYALEGSINAAGSLCQWVKDNLNMVSTIKEIDDLAASVPDSGGVYIVPAFSGLFAPYWRSDARGVIAGLTGFANRAHICRAVLESVAFQAYDIFKAMESDSGNALTSLKVDGGMTNALLMMAFQSDILSIPVIFPIIRETTSLGAAYAAGLTVGLWRDLDELKSQWKERFRYTPTMDDKERLKRLRFWEKAVQRTLEWENQEES